jgi:hypothetical protein
MYYGDPTPKKMKKSLRFFETVRNTAAKATADNSGQTLKRMDGATSYATSNIHGLKDALNNANMNGFNNQLGMTCQKVFGVSLAVNAVTGAFKALVGQWRHALDGKRNQPDHG